MSDFRETSKLLYSWVVPWCNKQRDKTTLPLKVFAASRLQYYNLNLLNSCITEKRVASHVGRGSQLVGGDVI